MQKLPADIPVANIDDYIALQPVEFRPQLEKIRSLVLSIVPDAIESLSYQTPCFKYIYMLVGMGVNKKYCSFYTMSPPLIKALQPELKGINISGTTLHFLPQDPLPTGLLEKIVKARVKENQDRSLLKRK